MYPNKPEFRPNQLITKLPEVGHYVWFNSDADEWFKSHGVDVSVPYMITGIEHDEDGDTEASRRFSKVGNFRIQINGDNDYSWYHFSHFFYDRRLICNESRDMYEYALDEDHNPTHIKLKPVPEGFEGLNDYFFLDNRHKLLRFIEEETEQREQFSNTFSEGLHALNEDRYRDVTNEGQEQLKNLVFELYQRGFLVLKDKE